MRIRFTIGRETEGRAGETILDAARREGVPIGNSCGGTGVCARCRVSVEGDVTPPTEVELRVGVERRFSSGERLACQTIVLGDCLVKASYW